MVADGEDRTLTVTQFRQELTRSGLTDLMMAIGRHRKTRTHVVITATLAPHLGIYWLSTYIPGKAFNVNWSGTDAAAVKPATRVEMERMFNAGYRPVEERIVKPMIRETRPKVHRHLQKHPDYVKESLRRQFGSSGA